MQPKRRFKVFQGDWKALKLTHLCKINYGKRLKKKIKGNCPVFGSGGLISYTNDCLADEEVVFVGRKGNLGFLFYHSGPYWAIDTLFFLNQFSCISPHFLFYSLQRYNWATFNETSTVPSLSRTKLKDLEIAFPCPAEQRRIVSFLCLLQKRLLSLKEEKECFQRYFKTLIRMNLKKEMVGGGGGKLFYENNLDDIFSLKIGSTPSTKDSNLWGGVNPWLTTSDLRASCKYVSSTQRTLTNKALKKRCVFCAEGSLVLSFKLTLGRTAILAKDMFINEGLCCLSLKKTEVSLEYLYYLLREYNWEKKANLTSKGKTLNLNSLKKMTVCLPSLKQQKKWASCWEKMESYLETLDKEIELSESYQFQVLQILSGCQTTKTTPYFQDVKDGKRI